MDKRTIARIEAHQNSLAYLQTNSAVYQGFVPLEDSIAAFAQGIQEVFNLSGIKSKNTTGATTGKTGARIQLSFVTVTLAKKAIVWARKTDRWAEMAILDIEETDIKYGELQLAIDTATNVLKVLTDYETDLGPYRIGKDQTTELAKAIANMGEVENVPRQNRDERHLAGKEINGLMQKLLKIEDDISSLVVGEFSLSHPSFVEGYVISKRIDDPAYRKTLIMLTVKTADTLPVANAWCDIIEMADEEQLTNQQGVAEITAIKTGTYSLHVSKEGFETYKTIFSIKRGERISFEIVLKPHM